MKIIRCPKIILEFIKLKSEMKVFIKTLKN
jgi:hypothetical protein